MRLNSSSLVLLPLLAAGCPMACAASLPEPAPADRVVVEREADTVRFAVIGDYGSAGDDEAAVAALVSSWEPDLIVTVGDNNYPVGGKSTIDDNIGQYYHAFISPYRGSHGEGSDINRFFPTLGNHDWMTWNIAPYLEYFTLPGNERYYDFRWGPVHFFALDSDKNEPDGNEVDGVQARWLQERLSDSDAEWQVVYMHHPPYSSGRHGSEERAQWPYHEWGADLVLSGHDHHYERVERPEGTYLVNGLGGFKKYNIRRPIDGSEVRYNDRHGALRAEATAGALVVEFIDIDGTVIDRIEMRKDTSEADPAPSPDSEPAGPKEFERYED